ncbi:MAG: PhzF family phenazine biosynthesis protein, partial [Alphaproteobacteria bacterium]|nr:PhzF family phenazine biosynthesis protein [Alphaproteobacteria bacterium]
LAGLVEVTAEAGLVSIAAPQPLSLGPEMPVDLLAACVGLAPADIVTSAHRPRVASVGNPFVICEVTGEALTRAQPDITGFRAASARFSAPGFGPNRLPIYLYALAGARVRTRMFSPLSGTIEDAATGSAATPLAALLLSLGEAREGRYDIVQGVEMGRPSLLRCTAHRAADGIRATVGGSCVPVLAGEVTL